MRRNLVLGTATAIALAAAQMPSIALALGPDGGTEESFAPQEELLYGAQAVSPAGEGADDPMAQPDLYGPPVPLPEPGGQQPKKNEPSQIEQNVPLAIAGAVGAVAAGGIAAGVAVSKRRKVAAPVAPVADGGTSSQYEVYGPPVVRR